MLDQVRWSLLLLERAGRIQRGLVDGMGVGLGILVICLRGGASHQYNPIIASTRTQQECEPMSSYTLYSMNRRRRRE